MNKMQTNCFETWHSVWSKRLDISEQLEYHLTTRKPLYGLLNRSIASLSDVNGLRILEIGCGTAIDSSILADSNKRFKVFCLDISYPAVKLAREIAEKFNASLSLLNCDANLISLKNESFDLIFSQGVLEHFKDISLVMEEQVRLLKTGGILIIDVPQTYTLYTLFKQKKIKNGTWPYGWETQFSYNDLISLGHSYGLKVLDVCGHEYDSHVRFFNFVLLRNIVKRIINRNAWNNITLLKKIDSAYDGIWNVIEKRWGHYFLVNIAVAFKKSGDKQ